jgi:hypothetical protein
MAGKMHSFRLEDDDSTTLDHIAKLTHTNRSEAVRRSIYSTAQVMKLGRVQLREALSTLHDRIGDAWAIIAVEEGAQGEPVAHLVVSGRVDGANPIDVTGLKAVAHVIDGGRVAVFLDFGSLPITPEIVQIGTETTRVTGAQLAIDTLSWPPNPKEAIRLPVGDMFRALDEAPEGTSDPVEA